MNRVQCLDSRTALNHHFGAFWLTDLGLMLANGVVGSYSHEVRG